MLEAALTLARDNFVLNLYTILALIWLAAALRLRAEEVDASQADAEAASAKSGGSAERNRSVEQRSLRSTTSTAVTSADDGQLTKNVRLKTTGR